MHGGCKATGFPPPITTIAAAETYRERILAALPDGTDFNPLMTCYLTDAAEIARGYENGAFAACKLYPAHATTNSAHGVTDIRKLGSVLEAMQRIGMPLLIHGEVTDRTVDIFDREAVSISPLAGLKTSIVAPSAAAVHAPSMKSCVSL